MGAFAGVNTTTLLVAGMKVAQQGHRLFANNNANADTPGYRPVDWTSRLGWGIESRTGDGSNSAGRTPGHLGASRYWLGTGWLVRWSKNDYNKVDIEEENTNLAQNRDHCNKLSNMLTKRFSMVKNMLATAP